MTFETSLPLEITDEDPLGFVFRPELDDNSVKSPYFTRITMVNMPGDILSLSTMGVFKGPSRFDAEGPVGNRLAWVWNIDGGPLNMQDKISYAEAMAAVTLAASGVEFSPIA